MLNQAPPDDDGGPRRIDRLLCAAATYALPLTYLEPQNSREESVKVGADPKYNPQFTYAPQDADILKRLHDELRALEIGDSGVEIFMQQARDYICKRLHLRLNLGGDVHWEKSLYPAAPDRVVNLARSTVSAYRPSRSESGGSEEKPFGPEDQARMIRARLRQYGLADWQVIIRPNISSANTDSANHIVNIRGDVRYTMQEMKRLVVHEVDTHVLRAANGNHQPYGIFALAAVPTCLMTEEGLAVVNEERMGYNDEKRTRTFSGRVLASVHAATASFSEVYQEQRDVGFSHEEAFTTTKRVKRGLGDTRRPGGYVKDHVYLWGRLMIEEFVLSGGDLSRLYVGKVALEHLPIIRELGLRPPRHIPFPL